MDGELSRVRWATFAALALVFGLYLLTVLPWHPLVGIGAALVTSGLLTAVLELWLRLSLRRADIASRPLALEVQPAQVESLLALQQKFFLASSERDIVLAALQAGSELLRADGASFVPYDEFGQAIPALGFGEVPAAGLQDWPSRLALPETRQTCKNCEALDAGSGCVLIPREAGPAARVRCFPLESGGRDVGMLNYFFKASCHLTEQQLLLLRQVIHAAGMALENLRARDQEVAALRFLQTASVPKSDSQVSLKELLDSVHQALDVDFALIYIPGGIESGVTSAPLLLSRSRAEAAIPDLTFLEGVWKSVLASGHSMSLENVTLNKREMWKAFLAIPLTWQESSPAGVLVLGSNSSQAWAQRHLLLLETLASQAAILIQNARLMVQVEYQAVVDERTRLAREIHDGLAQTLAFLKIQAAQMQSYLTRGETERLTSTLQSSYRTLSDAYLDARQAIDNLRRVPSSSLRDWIGQVASDFEQGTGIKVDLGAFAVEPNFAPNIQAQLIRIVQEALSNIRKHARADRVTLSGFSRDAQVIIEVCDNGVGFLPEQVDAPARYGLRGMRERADGIGAEFQITSQPGQGTVISISLPLPVKEEM